VTPAEIADEIRSGLADLASGPGDARRLLTDALDALSDGLPADHVAAILRAALGRLDDRPSV
jgi:hypothetical protein